MVAHRFGTKTGLSYTLDHLEALLDRGIRHIEADVRLMADGEYLCAHDASLVAQTGRSVTVATLNSKDLHRYPVTRGMRPDYGDPNPRFITLREFWARVKNREVVLWLQLYGGSDVGHYLAHLESLAIPKHRIVQQSDFADTAERQARLLQMMNEGYEGLYLFSNGQTEAAITAQLTWLDANAVRFAGYVKANSRRTQIESGCQSLGIHHGPWDIDDHVEWADIRNTTYRKFCFTDAPVVVQELHDDRFTDWGCVSDADPRNGLVVLSENYPYGINVYWDKRNHAFTLRSEGFTHAQQAVNLHGVRPATFFCGEVHFGTGMSVNRFFGILLKVNNRFTRESEVTAAHAVFRWISDEVRLHHYTYPGSGGAFVLNGHKDVSLSAPHRGRRIYWAIHATHTTYTNIRMGVSLSPVLDIATLNALPTDQVYDALPSSPINPAGGIHVALTAGSSGANANRGSITLYTGSRDAMQLAYLA